MKNKKNQLLTILFYLAVALGLRFLVVDKILRATNVWWLQIMAILTIFGLGIGYVFRGTAKIIEETTDVLKDRTKLAGGFLQALGTAFPDLVIGVVAALMSLMVRNADYVRAVNLAIIAAATTFGSNIYNILHAAWCVFRQNLANKKHQAVLMFPGVTMAGTLKPFEKHQTKPTVRETDSSIRILLALTLLSAFVAVSMVLFGQVRNAVKGIEGDLYQLIRPVGIVLFILCIGVLYIFRKSHRAESPDQKIVAEEHYYAAQATWRIWLDLLLSGAAILFAAESMVNSMEVFSHLTHIPFVVTGILTGLVGCFGEIMVIHNFSIHPNGRIGDALVGVAMDNIVTTLGAAIVAILGGIFLGSNSLILIFIIILTANTLLIEEISKMKNSLAVSSQAKS